MLYGIVLNANSHYLLGNNSASMSTAVATVKWAGAQVWPALEETQVIIMMLLKGLRSQESTCTRLQIRDELT